MRDDIFFWMESDGIDDLLIVWCAVRVHFEDVSLLLWRVAEFFLGRGVASAGGRHGCCWRLANRLRVTCQLGLAAYKVLALGVRIGWKEAARSECSNYSLQIIHETEEFGIVIQLRNLFIELSFPLLASVLPSWAPVQPSRSRDRLMTRRKVTKIPKFKKVGFIFIAYFITYTVFDDTNTAILRP